MKLLHRQIVEVWVRWILGVDGDGDYDGGGGDTDYGDSDDDEDDDVINYYDSDYNDDGNGDLMILMLMLMETMVKMMIDDGDIEGIMVMMFMMVIVAVLMFIEHHYIIGQSSEHFQQRLSHYKFKRIYLTGFITSIYLTSEDDQGRGIEIFYPKSIILYCFYSITVTVVITIMT